MIDFSQKTYANIQKEMLEQIPDTIDKREGSVIQTALGPAGWYLEGFYLDLDAVQKNAYVKTAGGESLELKCMERGIVRKKATPAVKSGAFNVAIPVGSRFASINSETRLVYKTVREAGKSGDGHVYELQCETAGQIGNSYSGQLMAIDYVTGLIRAELTALVISGTDEESDDSLRERYLSSFETASFAGNISAYRNEILSIEGVGAVQIYPAWRGGGTVLCSILNGNYRPADNALIKKVQTIICPPEDDGTQSSNGYGFAPIGALVTIGSGTELKLNITCNVQFRTPALSSTYQAVIEQKIGEYLDSVCETWGNRLRSHKIEYSVVVYTARIIAAVLSIPDVVNVTDIAINESQGDLVLVENAELQQVPVLGEVTINVS